MRGKDDLCAKKLIEFRITPAYAGKRNANAVKYNFYKDHPRLCGEKTTTAAPATRRAGSPPPMRGKGKMAVQVNRETRITPAYAGKSNILLDSVRVMWDHPRLCGEKPTGYYTAEDMEGSPPPMRGKVCVFRCPFIQNGITPAYAGKRWQKAFIEAVYRDHPRLCGEKNIFR